MARVLVPVMPRRYNHNPRGSATAQVVMAGDNPFERRTTLVNASRGMLPGLGTDPTLTQLQDGAVQAAQTTASSGWDWGSFGQKLAETALNIGGTYATSRIEKLYGPEPAPIPKTTGITPLPVAPTAYPPPAGSGGSKTLLIVGALAVVGVGAFLMLRKKRR